MIETWLQNKEIYRGRIVSIRLGEVRLEDGRTAQREIIEHPGGAAIVPVLNDNSIIMVRQFRISIGKEILELPGGRLESGESPEHRACCELEEEIGYRAESIVPLAQFYSSPGFTNERVYIFLAFGLRKTAQNPEWDENVQLVTYSLKEAREMLLNGEFEDANAIIGLHGLFAYLQKQAGSL